MLFSEIYSVYYSVIAAILGEAVDGGLTGRRIDEIVREHAFGESALTIPTALRSGQWPLIDRDGGTPIRHRPTVPLTTLERRWLKTVALDPRVALFSPDLSGLEDAEPLYLPDSVVYFDRYADGDPYTNPEYIAHFRTVLRALRERRYLSIRFRGRHGNAVSAKCVPLRLEYSAKDDKFRLITGGVHRAPVINLARIVSCELLETFDPAELSEPEPERAHVTFLLCDSRNALERVMLCFSHLEKTTVRLDDSLYEVNLVYDRSDETEILIRILSFGPMIKVTEPEGFVAELRERLERQAEI